MNYTCINCGDQLTVNEPPHPKIVSLQCKNASCELGNVYALKVEEANRGETDLSQIFGGMRALAANLENDADDMEQLMGWLKGLGGSR